MQTSAKCAWWPRSSVTTLTVIALAGCFACQSPESEPSPASSQTASLTSDTSIARGGLADDVALFRRVYEALHPGLYRYNTQAQLDAAFGELARQFANDQSLADVYLALSRFTAAIRCGHSYANFYNQSDAVADALFTAPRLPFWFRWIDGRMVVTRAFAGVRELGPGTEVVAIDGHPAPDILKALLPYARADGGNDAKRIDLLEARGRDRYETFDVFFGLVFRKSSSRFQLVVRPPGSSTETALEVDGFTRERQQYITKHQSEGPIPAAPMDLRWLDATTACLRTPNWALYDSKWDWRAFLVRAFEDVVARGAQDLIIDIRGNEGGLGIGDVILAHLTDHELPAEPIARLVRYREVPASLRPHLDTWDKSFFDWGATAVEAGDGFLRLTKYDDDPSGAVIKPQAPRFAGRTWILVDASNSSATFEFAQAASRAKLATIVGRPTGGNRRGINGGAFFFLRLPNSGIEVDVPLIGQFPSTPQPDTGVAPDILVPLTAEDVATGRDTDLEAVLARIRALRAPTDAR